MVLGGISASAGQEHQHRQAPAAAKLSKSLGEVAKRGQEQRGPRAQLFTAAKSFLQVSILSSLRHNRIVSLFESIESQDYLHLVTLSQNMRLLRCFVQDCGPRAFGGLCLVSSVRGDGACGGGRAVRPHRKHRLVHRACGALCSRAANIRETEGDRHRYVADIVPNLSGLHPNSGGVEVHSFAAHCLPGPETREYPGRACVASGVWRLLLHGMQVCSSVRT